MIQRLAAELTHNVRRYHANIAELKWLLYYVGDEPAALLAEWDWRWPAGARLEAASHGCFDSPHWRDSISAPAAAKVDSLYQMFRDQPPSMDGWSEQWLGDSNLFYVFIFEKLDERAARVVALAHEVNSLIHDARTGMRSR